MMDSRKLTIDAHELQAEIIPEREYLLEPLFFRGSLSLVHAWTGVGKTIFSLWVAAAIAAGGTFVKWFAPRAYKVLYIDGELGKAECQLKVFQIAESKKYNIPEGNFHFLTPDLCPNFEVPNLADPKQHEFYSTLAADFDFIVIDNYLSICRRYGRQSDEEIWSSVQPWLVKQRVLGKSVLIVHHSGKGGSQLGTSVKEHILNTTIHLRRPPDYRMEDGARFDVIFEKDRNFQARGTEPMELKFITDGLGLPDWAQQSLDDANRARVKKMLDLRINRRQIAEALNLQGWEITKFVRELEATNDFELPKNHYDEEDRENEYF